MSQNKNYNQMTSAEQIQHLDQWIRQGRKDLVLIELNQMHFQKVSRNDKVEYAEISRRVDEFRLCLKIMNPIIRSKLLLDQPPSPREKLVYASALTNLGFRLEAQEIYTTISEIDLPESLLQQAWLKFGAWQYNKAIPLIRRYLSLENVSPYRKIVGQVNLLAAFVAVGKLKMAGELSKKLLESTKSNDYQLLHGNILELTAQIYIFELNYVKAMETLEKAAQVLEKFQGLYFDFVSKWKLVCELMTCKPEQLKSKAQEVAAFRAKSLRLGYWELVRDCDLFLAIATKNKKEFLNTLGKTQSLTYRRRALSIWQNKIMVPKKVVVSLTSEPSVLDVRDLRLIAKPVVQLLLETLTKDLYKPFSVGSLFSLIYPGQYYDPETSVLRVQNAIHHARLWLKKYYPLIQIQTLKSEYSLIGQGQLIIYKNPFDKLKTYLEKFPLRQKEFVSEDMVEHLRISKRHAQNVIHLGLKNKKLIRVGKGKSTRYKFSSNKAS